MVTKIVLYLRNGLTMILRVSTPWAVSNIKRVNKRTAAKQINEIPKCAASIKSPS